MSGDLNKREAKWVNIQANVLRVEAKLVPRVLMSEQSLTSSRKAIKRGQNVVLDREMGREGVGKAVRGQIV